MTVKELREFLQSVPDSLPVVLCSAAGNYWKIRSPWTITVLAQRNGSCFIEDRGEEVTPESEYGKRTEVLLVS